MGKVDKKNKEPKGKKKRGWLGRGQKAAVQIDQPDPHAADSLQETYRG